jgi:phage-related protein
LSIIAPGILEDDQDLIEPSSAYTARYPDAIYVLHAFQKKSKKGVATPKPEMDLVERRLKDLIEEKQRS